LLARADALLAGAVRHPGARSPGTWSLLSSRQREVARDVARGLTNKEIAARLGVSVRTVDMHVAHVLARLDCRTRAQAAARIATDRL
jgi:DNA-binding NarL/FixJ family response regulator